MALPLALLAPTSGVVIVTQLICVCKLCMATRSLGCARLRKFLGRAGASPAEAPAQDPEFLGLVKELSRSRRQQCARVVIFASWVANSALSLQVPLLLFGVGSPFTTELSVLPRAAVSIVLTVAALRPGLFSSERMRVVLLWATFANLCWIILMPSKAEYQVNRSAMISVVALLVSAFNLRFQTLIGPNIALGACTVISHFAYIPSGDGGDGQMLKQAIMLEAFMLAMRLMMAYGMDSAMSFLVVKEVEGSLGSCKQSAVASLLGMMCDAVLDMDDSKIVKDHFGKLAGMLMLGPGKSLDGEELSGLIVDDEDRARFQAMLRVQHQVDGERSVPSMLSLRLRDSIGNRIKVAVFHVPYLSIGGSALNLIGVREDADAVLDTGTQWCRSISASDPPCPPSAELRPEVSRRLQEQFTWLSSDHSSEHGDGSTRFPPSPLSDEGADDAAAEQVQQHPHRQRQPHETSRPCSHLSTEVLMTQSLPIRWMSPGMCQDLGVHIEQPAIEGQHKLGELLADGGERLLAKLQEVVERTQARVSEGHFIKCLGDWGFVSNRPADLAPNTPAPVINRTLWVNFHLPMKTSMDSAVPYLAIAMGKSGPRGGSSASRRSDQRRGFGGTAPSSTPRELPGHGGAAGPAATPGGLIEAL